MIDAQLLLAWTVDMPPDSYDSYAYSPWFTRQGDHARFSIEVIIIESAQFQLNVYHKNRDETGDGTTTGGSIARTSVGRETAEWTQLKELVRYRFRVSATKEGDSWALFRTLTAVWFDAALAP